MIEQALYSIETNLEFNQSISKTGSVPNKVLASFDLSEPLEIKLIEKHNRFSNIYICVFESQSIIVRSTLIASAKLLELQCQVFSHLPQGLVLRPIKNVEGNYVTCESDYAWMAYPYVEGPLFDGSPNQVLPAFQRCIEVTEQLELLGGQLSVEERALFPDVNFDASGWKIAIDFLVYDTPEPVLAALGKDLQSYLFQNNARLSSLVERLSTWPLPPASLIHYDLQHANIVMSEPFPTIIDLEDIYYSPKQISLSYCAFKLSRHVVFSNPGSKTWVISELVPEMTSMLKSSGVENRHELFGFSSIRNLNDIAYIYHLYYDRGMDFVLYDLRKKILNLLEAAELSDCLDRVGLR